MAFPNHTDTQRPTGTEVQPKQRGGCAVVKTVLAPGAPWPYNKPKPAPEPKQKPVQAERKKPKVPRKKGRDIDKRYIEWAARTLGSVL
jgi:hypothetical protein